MVAKTTTKKRPPAKPAKKETAPARSKPRAPSRTKKAKAPAKRKRKAARKAPAPKPTGRPSKIEQHVEVVVKLEKGKEEKRILTVAEAIVLALAHGLTIEKAAETVGVSATTVHNWLARGEEWREADSVPPGEEPFLEFLYATTRARAKAVELALGGIIEAGKEDWRAWAWFLERSFPDEYGRRTRLDHGGIGGDGETMTLAELFARSAKDKSTADGD